MKHKPVIGILAISAGQITEEYSIYLEAETALKKMNAKLVIFTPYGIKWKKQTVTGVIFNGNTWEKGIMSFPDVVYNRLYGTHPKTLARLAEELGSENVFNYCNRLDKIKVYQILANSQIKHYVPRTENYCCKTLTKWLASYKKIILKPHHGHYGDNIFLLSHNTKQYDIFVESLYRPKYSFGQITALCKWIAELMSDLPKQKLLLQQWIEPQKIDERYFDIRVLLQKNSSGLWGLTAIMSRIARLKIFVTNYVYRIMDGYELLAELGLINMLPSIEKICIQVGEVLSKQLGTLGELSIDFLIDGANRMWIIEVNGKPRKDLFEDFAEDQLLQQIYLQPLKFATYLAKKK